MRTILFLLVLTVAALSAEPSMVLKTLTGKEYREVKIVAVNPDGLKIVHAEGVAMIPFEQLSAEVQAQYKFDPVKAVEYRGKLEADKKNAAGLATAAKVKEIKNAIENVAAVKAGFKVLMVLEDGRVLATLWLEQSSRHSDSLRSGGLGFPHVNYAAKSLQATKRTVVLKNVGDVACGDLIEGTAIEKGVEDVTGDKYHAWKMVEIKSPAGAKIKP